MAQGREALLVRVAELYYEQGMSQQNIAELLGLSRPTVSRLLEEARACGVVEITVHSPLRKDPVLSARLRRELGLRDAVVLSGSYDYDQALRRCAQAAGEVFRAVLENGMTVGISWGRALRYFCQGRVLGTAEGPAEESEESGVSGEVSGSYLWG